MSCKKSVAIVGAGPAGCICAYYAQKDFDVTLFDTKSPLLTLLPTGGGRCNLAYAEFDPRELAKNYPRGEKFLYSVFSKYSTGETLEFFQKIGVETYIQDNLRIFPTSNSSKDVREMMLSAINKCEMKRETVVSILPSPRAESSQDPKTGKIPKQVRDDASFCSDNFFTVKTERNTYKFDKVIIAVGGHSGFSLAKNLGHTIIKPKPALVGLVTKENFSEIMGVSLKSISAEVFFKGKKITCLTEDILFTHFGISGPLMFLASSICARLDFSHQKPLKFVFNFLNKEEDKFKVEFQKQLNENSKKDIKNLVSEFVPKSFAEFILKRNSISLDEKCHKIDSKKRDLIVKKLCAFEVEAITQAKDGEVVTSGGVSLDEINPKTMESKLVKGLYFAGEVMDVDGFCGGFNLQNCWSTGYIAAKSL